METFADLGDYKILHGSCVDLLNVSGDCSATVAVADWEFDGYLNLVPQVVKESFRVLEVGGTLISVHYPDCNYYVRKEAEKYGLVFADEVLLPMKMSYLTNRYTLHKRTIGIMSLVKGSLKDRKWSIDNSEALARVFEANSEKNPVVTNFWGDKYFKNGFYNKALGKHSQAMPERTVKKMFDTIIPKEGSILDLFGGAGTILGEALERKIPCTSIELDIHNCNLMHERLKIYGK